MSLPAHYRATIFTKSTQAIAFLIEIGYVEVKIAARLSEPIASPEAPFSGQSEPAESFDAVLREVKEELRGQESAAEMRAREKSIQETPEGQSARLQPDEDKTEEGAKKADASKGGQKADESKADESKAGAGKAEASKESEKPKSADAARSEKKKEDLEEKSGEAHNGSIAPKGAKVRSLDELFSVIPDQGLRFPEKEVKRLLTEKESADSPRKALAPEGLELKAFVKQILRPEEPLDRKIPAGKGRETAARPENSAQEKESRWNKLSQESPRVSTEELLTRMRALEEPRQNSREAAAERLDIFKNTDARSRDKVVIRAEERNFHGSKEEGNSSLLFSQQVHVRQGEALRTEAMRTLDPRDFKGMLEKARFELEDTGRSTASIRLRPESLGVMTVNLETRGETVKGSVIVESQAALKAVERELETLRADLRLQGISVTEFSVKIKESFFSSQEFSRESGFEMTGQFQPGRDQEPAESGFFHFNGYHFEENTEPYNNQHSTGLINVSA
ncbi:MAG: flagellar hook-length control protein FliK [Spirochaetales bacterium]|nr:flagellar hook-length control protein FliK [Spirochaetales bacterium]